MAKGRFFFCAVVLLAISAAFCGNGETKIVSTEEEEAVYATIKEEDRQGVDKLLLGHFDLRRTDDTFVKVLEAAGYARDFIRKIFAMKELQICITKKDDTYTMWTKGAGLHAKNSFQFDMEYTDNLIDGRSFPGIMKVIGDNKIVREVTIDSDKFIMEALLEDNGFVVTYKIKNLESIQKFLRKRHKH